MVKTAMGASSPLSAPTGARPTRQLVGLLLFALLVSASSCTPQGSAPSDDGSAEPAMEPSSPTPPNAGRQAAQTPPTRQFGAPMTPQPSEQLSAVLEKPETFANQTVTVEGFVSRVCSRKGCWMEVAASASPDAPSCRVTFKDYGFFVPTDSAGRAAKLQGRVQVQTLDAARVDHLESEGGNFPTKNPDGSVTEVRIVASGVELAEG